MTDEASSGLPVHRETRAAALDRRLTEAEVERVLKRAGRAEDGAAALARHDDVSVSDLMAAAEEVGLDPGAVKRAAALGPLQHTDRSMSIWGAPLPRSLRATIDAPIPDLRHELTEAAERILGRRGEVVITQEGHFQWEESHGTGSTRLTLKEGSLTTSLEIETDRTGHYAVVLFGSFVAGLAALSAVGGLTGAVRRPRAVIWHGRRSRGTLPDRTPYLDPPGAGP